jgi:hypothetical protein
LAVKFLDENRNLWRLQVLGGKPFGQINFQLMRRFSSGLNLADEGVVDGSSIRNLHALGKIRHLEDCHVENVKRPNFICAVSRCRR